MKIAELWVYPIKGCRGIALPQAIVMRTGLQYDRQWMIVDESGQFITQRQFPQLTQIVVTWDDQTLKLTHAVDSDNVCSIPLALEGTERAVQVWRSQTIALDQGDEVAAWLTAVIEHSVRLVRQSPQHLRPIDPAYAKADDVPVSFADGYPILVTNMASLDDLNTRLAQKYGDRSQCIPMNRFRPNVVVVGELPFAEDHWSGLKTGAVDLNLVKPCDRCIVTTTDQHHGTRHPQQEPLKTLATFRKRPRQGILFGVNAIPQHLGEIRVGEEVQIVEQLP
ncbi:MAG: MOSC domain-containing protein [Spirulina sp. SIO3F2]|nr:MOSC domain-containing protein [Spirulina sp. SIO3F2]